MYRGMSLLASVTALAIAAALLITWSSLWQQQQRIQRVQQWRLGVLQLQQAQRDYFRQQQRFASSQQQLIDAGLLPHPLRFAQTSAWQFEPQGYSLLMHANVTLASPELLLGRDASYIWQPPLLTLKVVGFVNP